MFDALRREIERILGNDFAVFFEYNTNSQNNEQILNEYKNVGVLYVNYGDLKLLPDNQGLTGAMQLDLLMCVKDGAQLESVVSKPIYDLLACHNGVLNKDNKTNYQYLLNYHMPTSTGEEHVTTEGIRYVIYSLPIDVTMSDSSLMLGDQFLFEIQLGNEFIPLKNRTTNTLAPRLTLDSHTPVNSSRTKSTAIASAWGKQVVFLFDGSDPLHKAIYKALDETPETVWKIRYKPDIDGYEYKTREVLFHDSTVTFERGEFAVLVLNMCEVG